MLQNLKIRNRMFVLILGTNLIILILIFSVYFGFAKKIIIKQTEQKAKEKVIGVANSLEDYLDKKSKLAWTFSQHPLLIQWLKTNDKRLPDIEKDGEYKKIIYYLKDIVKRDGEISSAYLASERTQMYYDNAERSILFDVNYRVGMRPWYINTMKKGGPMFDVDVDFVSKGIFVNYRYPIYDEEGKPLGVGGIDISIDNFVKFVSRLDDVFDTGQAYLVGEDGLFLCHPNSEFVLKKRLSDMKDDGKHFKNMNSVFQKIVNGQEGMDIVVYEGEQRYFIYRTIENLHWTIILSVSVKEVNAPLISLSRVSLLVILLASLLLGIVIVFMMGSISRPIENLVIMLRDIAEGEGNISKRIEIRSKDELGELAGWFNVFVDKLHQIISQVKKNTEEVAAATGHISATSAQLASGAEEQTIQASDVATSVHEITASIVQTSQNAAQTAKITDIAKARTQEGTGAMQATQQGMDEIVATANQTSRIIHSLSDRAGQIGEIIQVINDIADQTNLLALNAAIEAARAGERGRGFAVVADEVRKLAERTTKATKEIGETIKDIQTETEEASRSMMDVNEVVAKGKELTVKTEGILKEIAQSVMQTMDMIQQIAVASEEQSSGAEEISVNVEAISTVTKQSASAIEELAQTAESLNSQTAALMGLVNQFTLSGENLKAASSDVAEHNGGVSEVIVNEEGQMNY